MKRGNCAAPTETNFDLSVSPMESNQLHLEVGWCAFHVNRKQITEQFKPTFLGFKVGKSPGKLGAEFFNKLCTWKHVGRDLLFNVLEARKMAQVSLQHLSLPQAQLGLA